MFSPHFMYIIPTTHTHTHREREMGEGDVCEYVALDVAG